MKARLITIGILTIALGTSCTTSAVRPPSPLPPANAMLESYAPLYSSAPPDTPANIILNARCLSSTQFAKQSHGQWNHFWYLVTFDVLTVEKGTWPQPTLSFICMDAWPTADSGILLDKAPWPYRPGTQMRFHLDTTKTPPQISAQEDLPSTPPTRPTQNP